MQVGADSILRLTRAPAAGYELRLSRAPAAGTQVTADSSCGLRLTPSHGRLEFRRLETSYSRPHSTADSSSGGWIRLKADTILRLTRVLAARYELQLIPSCSWLQLATDPILQLTRVLLVGLDLRLLYTLIC